MDRARSGIAAVLLLVYPLLVYTALDRVGPRAVALLLLALFLLRWIAGPSRERLFRREAATLVPVVLLAGVATFTGDERALFSLPVVVNLALAATFWTSLRPGRESVIERIARIQRGISELPPTAARYCRRLTRLWTAFFVANAAAVGMLALWASAGWWALYSGLVAYLLVGSLLVLEYGYRCWKVEPIAEREALELGIVSKERDATE